MPVRYLDHYWGGGGAHQQMWRTGGYEYEVSNLWPTVIIEHVKNFHVCFNVSC